jgi:hypothetical protein
LPRLRNSPIKPIHIEELLSGAGMSGFVAIVGAPPAGQPTSTRMSVRVASVVRKMEALTGLIEAADRNVGRET